MKKYFRISAKERAVEIIKSYILEHGLSSGDMLPSEREFSRDYGLSRTTFRSAIEQLKKEFLLYSVVGSGTYVADEKFVMYMHDAKSTTSTVEESGKTLTTEIVSSHIIEANKEIALNFKQVLGAPFFELIRCRSIDGIPIFYETAIIDYDRFKGIDQFDFAKESLFHILETKYNTKITHGTESLGITFPTKIESDYLRINQTTPVYIIQSLNYDSNNVVTEMTKRIVRADKVMYVNEYFNERSRNE